MVKVKDKRIREGKKVEKMGMKEKKEKKKDEEERRGWRT